MFFVKCRKGFNVVESKLVSIVLLNWNGEKHIHRCLEYVVAQSYKNIEVVFVDNASQDGSVEKVEKKFPHFTYIKNKQNRGYAVGMNQGIEASKGEFVIPLNQDVCLHKDFVRVCVERMSTGENIGALGGKVYAWIGDELTSGLRRGDGGVSYLRKRFQGYGGIQSTSEELSFSPSGSFPFLRRKMLDDLFKVSGHYYDERFVTGWEDTDLFLRMNLFGWECRFLPEASGWHVGSGSVGGQSHFIGKKVDYQARVLRNRHFTIIKNLPPDIMFWLFPYLLVTELGIPFYFLVRSPKSLVALCLAWVEVITELPSLMKKRRLIQKNIRIPKGHLKKFFCRY